MIIFTPLIAICPTPNGDNLEDSSSHESSPVKDQPTTFFPLPKDSPEGLENCEFSPSSKRGAKKKFPCRISNCEHGSLLRSRNVLIPSPLFAVPHSTPEGIAKTVGDFLKSPSSRFSSGHKKQIRETQLHQVYI